MARSIEKENSQDICKLIKLVTNFEVNYDVKSVYSVFNKMMAAIQAYFLNLHSSLQSKEIF